MTIKVRCCFLFALQNYQWTARVSLHELGYHKASGALVATNATVIFDPTTGLAQFQNLQITANGMYLVTFNVFTPDNTKYNFNCFSNAITVETSVESYDASLPPNYVLKYEGDYSAIGTLNQLVCLFSPLKSCQYIFQYSNRAE